MDGLNSIIVTGITILRNTIYSYKIGLISNFYVLHAYTYQGHHDPSQGYNRNPPLLREQCITSAEAIVSFV